MENYYEVSLRQRIGPNYKGDNIYEFIFSDVDEVWVKIGILNRLRKTITLNVEYIKKVMSRTQILSWNSFKTPTFFHGDAEDVMFLR